jgi:hypothetical protein
MKTKTAIALLSLASIATSTLVCACGSDHTAPAAPVDAAAGGVEMATVDAALETSAPTGSDASDAGFAVQATQLLDDMRGTAPFLRPGENLTDGPGTSGTWYTYSDRGVPWSVPPILLSDAGLLVPSDGVVFPATDDGTGPTYSGGAQPYRRCYGGGETVWGIGVGMDFIDIPPDGGDVPMNDCDAGRIFDVNPAGDDSAISLPFDASGWTGVQFWGRSLRGVAQQVIVNADDDSTSPWGLPVDAGGCNVCIQGTVGSCGDAFQAAVTFPTDWTHIQVPFASMHPQGWSGASVSAVPNVSRLFTVHFQIGQMGAPAVAPFDVAVAYIELYK